MEIFCLGNHSLKTQIFTPVCLHNFCLGSHSSKTQLFTKVLPQSTNHGLWHIRNPWMDMGKRGMSPAAETLSTCNQKLARKTLSMEKTETAYKNGQRTETYLASSPSKISILRGSHEIQIEFRYSTITVFHETSYSS